MAFVKLDCGILDSTIWPDREAREIFITALLMAKPHELFEGTPQIHVQTLDPTGFEVPAGWYGFIGAAGTGIIRRAGIDMEAGIAALERLGAPEMESRTPEFEGRRLVRINGGYIALNYHKYREKDHTAAIRAKRYRASKKKKGKEKPREVSQVYLDRERRYVAAESNGDQVKADRIAAEGIPHAECQ